MDNALDKLKAFYKAQTIRDPMAIATYVTTRYGIPDERKYSIARGIAGKSKAKQWNPTTGKAPAKGMRHAGRGSKRAVVRRKRPKYKGRQKRMDLSLEKAESINDSRKLAARLAQGRSGGSGGANPAPPHPWYVWEGGMRGKARAKEWNPIQDPDVRGYTYSSSGMRKPKEDAEAAKKKKRRDAAQKGAKTKARRGGGIQRRLPGMKSTDITKTFDVLLKAHKFGGKPLGWEELPRDPISFATNVMQDKGFKNTNLSANTDGANTRNKLAQGIRALINDIPDATKKEIKAGKLTDAKWEKEAKKRKKEMAASWAKGDREAAINLKKQTIPPALARMLGFGAGWMISDTFTEAPRGQMTPSQQRDWDRVVRSAMRRKKDLRKDGIDSLQSYYKDSSDTYVKRTPIENSLVISKDHAPLPPRQGLVWDEQKSHWTRQENVGKTVTEVQGKKRIRGSGHGAHEHSKKGAGGKGTGMSAEAGRRFRSSADAGIIKPHEGKHPGKIAAITRKKLLQHLRGRAGRRTRR